MLDYPYLEAAESRFQTNPAYRLAPQLEVWIRGELEKRREFLQKEHPEHQLQVFLTLRTFKRFPVFVVGYMDQEGYPTLLECSYFHMVPPPDDKPVGVQLVLDRIPVKRVFGE